MLILALLLTTSLSFATEYKSILLTENNTVVFKGAVSSATADLYGTQLLNLSARIDSTETIYLVLDSPGGSIWAGLNFISLMQSVPQNIECIANFAASMAHGFLQACPGKRYITPNGVSMIHRAQGSFGGQFNDGEVESRLEFWKSIVNIMEESNAKRMGLTNETYKQLAKDEFWCAGKNCVKYSFTDEVVSMKCSPGLLNKTYMYPNGAVLSRCPLIRGPVKSQSYRRKKRK
tara:strand:+ start:4783 stop:5481 length:699 start_codon:yes stop_codon:yes gene_type:complete